MSKSDLIKSPFITLPEAVKATNQPRSTILKFKTWPIPSSYTPIG